MTGVQAFTWALLAGHVHPGSPFVPAFTAVACSVLIGASRVARPGPVERDEVDRLVFEHGAESAFRDRET